MTAASRGRVVSLSAGTVSDALPDEVREAAAAAGFDGFGIRWSPDITPQSTMPGLRRRIEASGLLLLDLEVVRLRPDVPVAAHRPWVDAAGELDARFLLVVSQHPELARTRDELAALAQWCAPNGVTVSLEFMRFTAVASFGAASALVRSVGMDNLTVLVDALHLQRGGETPADLRRPDGARIGYVQVCDAPRLPPHGRSDDMDALAEEARHGRLFPGEGELPLSDLLRALPSDVPCCVEVQSDRWSYVDVRSRAQHAMATVRRLLETTDGSR